MHAELIVDARNAVGESPVWVAEENALYWVDIPAGGLQRWRADSGHVDAWTAPQILACIARQGNGRWVAGMESGFFELHPHNDGSLDSVLLADINHARPDMRLNDGRCDLQGRFWAGSMVLNMGANAAEGTLYRYSAGQPGPLEAHVGASVIDIGQQYAVEAAVVMGVQFKEPAFHAGHPASIALTCDAGKYLRRGPGTVSYTHLTLPTTPYV